MSGYSYAQCTFCGDTMPDYEDHECEGNQSSETENKGVNMTIDEQIDMLQHYKDGGKLKSRAVSTRYFFRVDKKHIFNFAHNEYQKVEPEKGLAYQIVSVTDTDFTLYKNLHLFVEKILDKRYKRKDYGDIPKDK